MPCLNRPAYWKLESATESLLALWLDRVKQRPAAQEIVAEYDAAILAIPAVEGAYISGKRQRKYRDHRLEWMIKCDGVDIVLEGLQRKNDRLSWRKYWVRIDPDMLMSLVHSEVLNNSNP